MVRPSTKSTVNESWVTRTAWARASAISLADAEVFIPFLQKELLVGHHQALHLSELRRREAAAPGQPYRFQPELGSVGVAFNMNVHRLSSIGRVEEEPVRPIAMDSRHRSSVTLRLDPGRSRAGYWAPWRFLVRRVSCPTPDPHTGLSFPSILRRKHLAVRQRVSASTQNQAGCALLFLCREVLDVPTGGLSLATRAREGSRLPVVLSVPETAALLGAMHGTTWLMAALIYGGGLRVSECCELRVKDVDFDQGLLFVRSGKGGKDRSTLLPDMVHDALRAQLRTCEARHRADRQAGLAGVWLPHALDRKYPNAGREPGWFWVFPSHTLSTDPRAGIVCRHHLGGSVIQGAHSRRVPGSARAVTVAPPPLPSSSPSS